MVKRAPSRWFTRPHPVAPIFLHQSGGNFGHDLVAEERDEVNTEPVSVTFHVFGIALSVRDGFVFAKKLISGVLETLAGLQFSRALFAFEFEIPVLREILRVLEALFLRADTMVLARKIRRALPQMAVVALVEMQFAAHKFVLFGHRKLPQTAPNV